MHGRILPRRAYNSCDFTMKMSFRYHRLLIYDVKQTTKIDGMGPFKPLTLTIITRINRVREGKIDLKSEINT